MPAASLIHAHRVASPALYNATSVVTSVPLLQDTRDISSVAGANGEPLARGEDGDTSTAITSNVETNIVRPTADVEPAPSQSIATDYHHVHHSYDSTVREDAVFVNATSHGAGEGSQPFPPGSKEGSTGIYPLNSVSSHAPIQQPSPVASSGCAQPGPSLPLTIEMDIKKFEEMFCIDPAEEQQRLQSKYKRSSSKIRPSNANTSADIRGVDVKAEFIRDDIIRENAEDIEFLDDTDIKDDEFTAVSFVSSSRSSSAASSHTSTQEGSTTEPGIYPLLRYRPFTGTEPSHHTVTLSSTLGSSDSIHPSMLHPTCSRPYSLHSTEFPFSSNTPSVDCGLPFRGSPSMARSVMNHENTPSSLSPAGDGWTPFQLFLGHSHHTPSNQEPESPALRALRQTITARTFTDPDIPVTLAIPPPTLSATARAVAGTRLSYYAPSISPTVSAPISRSETPMTDSQLSQRSTSSSSVIAISLTLDDLLTLEPLLPTSKEKSLFENYERQHRNEFDHDPEEAAKKLEPAERFMYWLSRPVTPSIPTTQQSEVHDSVEPDNIFLQVSKSTLSAKPSLTSLRSRLNSSNSMTSDLGLATEEWKPLSIEEYIAAAIAMLRFETDLETAESQILELTEGCDALRKNENLKVLFLGVLKVGNMLNTVYARRKPVWHQPAYASNEQAKSLPARDAFKISQPPQMATASTVVTSAASATKDMTGVVPPLQSQELDKAVSSTSGIPPPPPRPPIAFSARVIPPPPPPLSTDVKSTQVPHTQTPTSSDCQPSAGNSILAPPTSDSSVSYPPRISSPSPGAMTGGAAGFRLHSLLKLRDVRALDNKSNLMHYLAHMAAETNKDLLALPDQFRFLSKLEQYRTREILEQVVECERSIKLVRKFRERVSKAIDIATMANTDAVGKGRNEGGEIEDNACCSTLPVSDMPVISRGDCTAKESGSTATLPSFLSTSKLVIQRLDNFLIVAQKRYLQLLDAVELLDKSWNATAIYFGEKAPLQANTNTSSMNDSNSTSSTQMAPPPVTPSTPLPTSNSALSPSSSNPVDANGTASDILHPPFLDQMILTVPATSESTAPVGGSHMSRSPSMNSSIPNRAQLGTGGSGVGGNRSKYQRKPPEEIFAVLNEFFHHFREAHLQNEDAEIRKRRQEQKNQLPLRRGSHV
ncbi:hypothetical protein BGW41_000731 [Actinomortierella wolfii]|nr:hypothetical protein BGW41_000731 [Actinomortierella wolfii]